MTERRRIAWAGPLPPSTSGIADYSADLIRRLESELRLELFVDSAATPVDGAIRSRFRCRPLAELDEREAAGFDLVVYQIGNSAPHHAAIYQKALSVPGLVVLHETMLHHLVREMTLARGDARGYVDAMRYAAGRSGELAAERLLNTHFPVDVWSYPLFERLVDRSVGVIVHSDFARERVLASRPLARVTRVPMGIESGAPAKLDEEARGRLRATLGVAPGEFVIASFGFVTPQKRLEPALRAFATFRREQPGARFVVVGEVSQHFDFAELLGRTGADGVEVVGRAAPERFAAWMQSCDLAINLRHPTGGETSASLLRLLAHGRPTVVSATGSFAEVPDGACIHLPLDGYEEETLVALYRELVARPELARAIGAAGQRFAAEAHSLAASAAGYVDAIESSIGNPMTPLEPRPPLVAGAADDPWPSLLAAVGAEVADLGIGEGDDALLVEISTCLAELR